MKNGLKRGGVLLLLIAMVAAAPMSTLAESLDRSPVAVETMTEEAAADMEDVLGTLELEEEKPVYTDPLVALLEAQELNPVSPQSADLDAYLDELLATLITDDMTTYEQVKACYDYLVDNMRYGSHTAGLGATVGNTTARSIYSAYGEVEGFGAVALLTKQGLCNAYSSAFVLMMRKIGLDARLVSGSTKARGGYYTVHKWAEINIDGTAYVFDTQLEQNLRSSGLPAYSVFYKTYGQVGNRYIR
ncbi:MAG: transglutaminase domain-containing protein [Oscillospiraceae bacterium]